MTRYPLQARPTSVPRTHLRSPVATLRFSHGVEDLAVSATPLDDALLDGELRSPFPTVRAIAAGVSVSYPLGTLHERRAGPSSIRLDAATTWSVVVNGGATLVDLDLSEAGVAGLSFDATVDHCRLALPRPAGTCRIDLHTVADVVIERPADVPVRVEVRRRTRDVTVDGRPITAAPGWSSTTTEGYRDVYDRYLVVVAAAAERLRVDVHDAATPAGLTPMWTVGTRSVA